MRLWSLPIWALFLWGAWAAQAQVTSERVDPLAWQQDIQQHLQDQPLWQQRNFKVIWPARLPKVPHCSAPLSVQTSTRPVPAGWLALNLKCEPSRWSRQLEVRVQVLQQYLVAAHNLMPGHVLTESDLRWVELDSALAGVSIVPNLAQAVGKALRRSLTEGSPVRLNSLQEATVIKKGSIVTVLISGSGFELETRGQAMDNAPMGGNLRINIKEGTVLPARVISNGLVVAQ